MDVLLPLHRNQWLEAIRIDNYGGIYLPSQASRRKKRISTDKNILSPVNVA